MYEIYKSQIIQIICIDIAIELLSSTLNKQIPDMTVWKHKSTLNKKYFNLATIQNLTMYGVVNLNDNGVWTLAFILLMKLKLAIWQVENLL